MQIIKTLVEKIEIIEITLIKKIHLTEIIEKMTAEAEKEETTSIIETIQKTEMAMKTETIDLATTETEEMVNLIVQTMEIISEKIMETSIIKIITMETIITEDHQTKKELKRTLKT